MDQETRNRLIEQHMPRAQVIAAQIWKRTPATYELDELRAIAYAGLCQAAARWEYYCESHGYDPARIEFFTPYVVRRMNGAILDELRKTDWLSKTQRSTVKQIQKVTGDESNMSVEEIAKAVGITVEEVRTSLAGVVTKRPISLDSGEGIDVEAEDTPPTSPLVLFLVRAVASLDRSERAVLALHYFADRTLPDIATQLGISLADVKYYHKAAITQIYEGCLHAVPTLSDRV